MVCFLLADKTCYVLFHALLLSFVVLTGSKQGVGAQESPRKQLKGSIGSFIKRTRMKMHTKKKRPKKLTD